MVVFSYPKSIITGQPEIYEPNSAEVTLSKFLRQSCFYIVRKPYDMKTAGRNPYQGNIDKRGCK
uniref:Uncharacterized protein n=1 Tax=Myoviridae sp. ctZiv5 TaxID=2827289 RepID=A0A8S5R5D2_9CAUD|nr:MAG TPA: hypothetical protein [Myoviridae sp. ctZiv5]DAK81022.1 MAG TPA: hypothetical protein [Caudoviricetes sp.]DAL32557.1 MAG TPA_asm: hypothetical protein [Caudoviricetes sp.]DAZ77894.1 MAG TPA: hypothetical protein [Caudoviricetes sp.]